MTEMLKISAGRSPSYSSDARARMSLLNFGGLSRWWLSNIVQLIDVAVVLGAAFAVYPFCVGYAGLAPPHYLLITAVFTLICHLSFGHARVYDVEALVDETKAMRPILVRWTLLFLIAAAVAALAHLEGTYSRAWLVGFYGVGTAGLMGERVAIAIIMRKLIARGLTTQSVVVIGDNPITRGLIERLANNRSGIRVVGIFDDESSEVHAGTLGVPMLGGIDDLLAFSRRRSIDMVVITLPISETDRITRVVDKLIHQPLNIRVLPGAIGLDRTSPIRLPRHELPGIQLIAISERPLSDVALFAKRAIDIIAAGAALIVALPIFVVCAIGISTTSPGPVYFRQRRIGHKGREFNIIKFRTMDVVDHPHIHLTRRNDPRIFPFGAILRKLSIDELPQLLNVLKGDMSLVGPRPHMPEARAAGKLYFEAVGEYACRHRVKPGITGWAQVNGWRGPTETIEQIERRVEHDIYYIDNWSLTLDFIILIKTLFVGFFGKNAF